MSNITVVVFEHFEITSTMDVYKRLSYTQRTLRGCALTKYPEVLVTYKKSAKELACDEWTLVNLTSLSAEDFWTRANMDTTGYDVHDYLAQDKLINFERELWFELGKCIWRKHQSVYQDHMKYVHNDILKSFKVKVFRHAEHVREMHDLAKYLPLPLMKNGSAEVDNWNVCNQ